MKGYVWGIVIAMVSWADHSDYFVTSDFGIEFDLAHLSATCRVLAASMVN